MAARLMARTGHIGRLACVRPKRFETWGPERYLQIAP